MREQFKEMSLSPETPKDQIISGYSSIFDQIPQDPEEFKEYKDKHRASIAKIINAWTMPELYSATKEIIDLPDSENENEMGYNLAKLCNTEIPLVHKNPPVPAALWAFTIIDAHIMMRLASIRAEKAPKPDTLQ